MTHKITYEMVQGKIVTGANPLTTPLVRVYSDSMAVGTVRFNIPVSSKAEEITAEVYKVSKPDTGDPRWIRTGSDLFAASVLDFNGVLLNSTEYSLEFKFLPSNITGVEDGFYYSVEFFITVTQPILSVFSPKLIMSIHDRLF